MGHAVVPFVQHLFPVFMTSLKDEDDEVRSNTIYGLGVLAFYGGDIIVPYPEKCASHLNRVLTFSRFQISKDKQHQDRTWEQGWCSGESVSLPPMWPGFDSRFRCHMWVEFVVGSLPCSPFLKNQHIQIPIRS